MSRILRYLVFINCIDHEMTRSYDMTGPHFPGLGMGPLEKGSGEDNTSFDIKSIAYPTRIFDWVELLNLLFQPVDSLIELTVSVEDAARLTMKFVKQVLGMFA